MKLCAVVCEYNPFHNGHRYQLETARAELGSDAVVGIMSGNFVQRGDAAIFPKELRARAALSGGMDLVLELPAVLTLQSAERYARNAVMTLEALGCVDTLFFGAECPDTEILLRIADVLSQEDGPFRHQLRAGLGAGLSFAAARAAAVKSVICPASAEILSQPNNILAVEYCKALLLLKSQIRPHAIERRGAGHDAAAPSGGFASATAVRERLLAGQDAAPYLPAESREAFGNATPFSVTAIEKALIANLCLMPLEELRQTADVSEGLEHALKRAAFTAGTLAEVIGAVKSKRYAYSRLRRIVLNAYLGITQADTQRRPSYIRVLDFNDRGRQVLNLARKTAVLPLAKNGRQIKDSPEALELWQRELALDRIYHLFAPASR